MGLFSSAPEILNDVSVSQIVDLFKEEGYTAETATTNSGKPYLRFKVEGFTSCIYFYSEVEGKPGFYKSIQFAAGFRDKVSIERANQWNVERRFVKVYSDNDGELQFDQDIALDGGVTRKFLAERIKSWRNLFTTVLAFVAK